MPLLPIAMNFLPTADAAPSKTAKNRKNKKAKAKAQSGTDTMKNTPKKDTKGSQEMNMASVVSTRANSEEARSVTSDSEFPENVSQLLEAYAKGTDNKVTIAQIFDAAFKNKVSMSAVGAKLLSTATRRGKKALPEVEGVLQRLRQAKAVTASALPGYLFLAKSYALKGHFEQAEQLLGELRRAKVENLGTVLALLFELSVRTMRFDKGWSYLEQTLDANGRAHKVSVSLLLKKQRHPKGLQLVERFVAQQPADSDEVLFNSLLDACGRVNDMPRLERTLASMEVCGISRSAATYGTLLKSFGARNDFESVKKTWAEMKAAEIPMNAVTYGCMLDACVRCKQFSVVKEVWRELVIAGMHKNTVLYSTMIKGYVCQRDLPKALEMKTMMIVEGVALNAVTYNSLIDVAIRCKDWVTSASLLAEMRELGLVADLITYSTLIKGLCDMGKLDDAMHLFQHFEAEGVAADEILFNSLLEGCVKARAATSIAMSLLHAMRARGVAPSTVTVSIVLKLFAQNEDLDGAIELAINCNASLGVQPSAAIFTVLTKILVAGSRAKDAALILSNLPSLGLWPRISMCVAVIPSLVADDELETCVELLYVAVNSPRIAGENSQALRSNLKELTDAIVCRGSDPLKQSMSIVLEACGYTGIAPQGLTRSLSQQLYQAQGQPTWATGQEFVPAVAEFVPGQIWCAEQTTEENPSASTEVTSPQRRGA